jgi:hypothetical protein
VGLGTAQAEAWPDVKQIPFQEWLPDQPSYNSNGILVAQNVYPGARGYRPVGQFVQTVPAGVADFKGAATFTAPRGDNVIVGGTTTNLYRVVSGAWSSIATGYNTPSSHSWQFAQFGGLAIATNGANLMQKIDLESGTVSDLGGSPPTLRVLAVVKDFLVGGVVDERANEIAWCAINNAEDWTFGQNQSDYQIMPSGGDVNGIFGGEFGLILQRNRITRMDYVGGNEIFVINEVSTNFGCVHPNTVVQHGQIGCFLSDNGFMLWDGAQLKPIGSERIDRYFRSLYGRSVWPSMSAAVDVRNQCFKWSTGDKIFCYHYLLDRWSVINQAAQVIFSGVTRSISIDEDDGVTGDSNLDTGGLISLDDPSYQGGESAFYVINTSRVLGTLTGTPMAATLTLPDFELSRDRETNLRSIRPDTDATSGITLSISLRSRLGDAVTTTDYTSLQSNGDMPVRERGRYCRLSMTLAAGTTWTYAQGLVPDGVAGARK